MQLINFKSCLSILLVTLLLVGCTENKPTSKQKFAKKIEVDKGFSDYVNGFTSGVISNKSNIKVILMHPEDSAKLGEVVSEDVFSFEPTIKGLAYWLDKQTIEFRPEEQLPSNQTYEAKFHLSKLREVPSSYKTLNFSFVVLKQNLFVSYNGIRTDKVEPTKQELLGSVRTSDFATINDLKKCLKATQNGKDLEIECEHAGKPQTVNFIVKGVVRGAEKSSVLLSWDGATIGASTKNSKSVDITPIGEFSLIKISPINSPGLYFSVQFTDPVMPKQDLEGLITLKSGKKLRYVIDGNEVKAYPIRKLSSVETVTVNQSVKSVFGKTLPNDYVKVVMFSFAKPEVKLVSDGVIIPSSGTVAFPFKAINLKAINIRVLQVYEHNINQFFQENHLNGSSELARVGRLVYDDVLDLVSDEPIDYGEWNNFSVDLSTIVDREPGAIYRVLISFERYQSLYPCNDSTDQIVPLQRRKLNFDENFYFSNDSWFDGYSNYREREDPCKDSYYQYWRRPISANLLSSNFGIIAKESADNTFNITVTDLRTSDPLGGITVEAYNFQNVKIGEGRTNSSGALLLQTESRPYLLIAKQGKQRGYLRVDKGSAISLSLYDVGGAKINKGIKGFTYGERGIWRPGDTLFLSFMLEDKLNTLPETHPVIMELYDPMGKVYDRKVSNSGVNGLYSFKFVTDKNAPTGNWNTVAKVGNSSFHTYHKIETIKPNRIKIDYDFDDVIKPSGVLKTNLAAKWMYGAPGANLKATVEMHVSTVKTSFKGYDGFMFDDRSIRFDYNEPITVETKTNSEGIAPIRFNWSAPSEAPGMLKLSFQTKVYENGGDFSQDFLSKKYSPFTSYVGVKLDGGGNWISSLDTEKKHRVAIAAISADGEPLSGTVRVELYKMNNNWWWESDGESEVTRYINRNSSTHLKTQSFEVKDGKGFYDLSFPARGWGKYIIRVVDDKSGHSCATTFYGDYSGWWADSNGSSANAEAASALGIDLGKKAYTVGEDIECTVPSGGIGNILVSIEKGDKVLKQMWVKADANHTKFSFTASKEMSPNIYVSAVLIQPHGQTENSLPIRMFGVVPVTVFDADSKLSPVLRAPKAVEPESSFELYVSEKTGKAMSYTLAVVDEGLLSLTRFKTPNAWATFNKKEALSTRTWDMYRYVMNAQTGKLAAMLAIGGDENLNFKDEADANRFKPVVTYLGPFYLDKGQTAEHIIHVPNYIGAIRAMVVAGHEGAYGSTDKEILVNQPLMLLTTLPRVLGPSETLKVPVSVMAMSEAVKEVKVKVSPNDMLVANGETEQTVYFDKVGEKTIYFDFTVARKLGVAKLKVDATGGGESAYEELELSVRAPNPKISKNETKMLSSDEEWSFDYEQLGINGSASANVQISSLPDLNLDEHLQYLIGYPHGCIEQTTSKVFPQLMLDSFVKLSSEQEKEIQTNIVAALNKFKTFQIASGGFGYWPGSSKASEWGTNYAGHFMLEAKNKGYALPPGLLESWLKYQNNVSAEWQRTRYYSYGRYGGDLTQAYRLYTLALAGKANLGAMNRLRSDGKLSDAGAWRLAAAYAILGRTDVAEQLAERSSKIEPYYGMSYSYGSHVRDLAMILETKYYLKDKEGALPLIKSIAESLRTGWHSTQTRAYSLLAISRFVNSSADGDKAFKASLEINGKRIDLESDNVVHSIPIDEAYLKAGNVTVKNSGDNIIFVSFNQSGIPIEANDISVEKELKMSIKYLDVSGNSIDVKSLKQGTDFRAIVTLTHPGVRKGYKEMALTQIFPSGWQIVNKRYAVDPTSSSTKPFTYRDIRDDRVFTYFDLQFKSSVTFEVA